MAEASVNKGNKDGDDTSMEEILQSIRRIIAEEGEEGAAEPAKDDKKPENPVAGSDVLELTEMVNEDGSVVSIKNGEAKEEKAAAEKPAEPALPPEPAAQSADVLSQIEEALEGAQPAAKPAAAATPPANKPSEQAPQEASQTDALLSEQSKAAAAASIKKLQSAAEPPVPPIKTTPSPALASGKTVEDMVAAMLRPMIKEWLDANLPAIVERIVTLEIRRLSK